MNTKLRHIAAAVYGRPWFIVPEQLAVIADVVQLHLQGGTLSKEEIDDRLQAAAAGAGPRGGARTMGAVGVIPIYGAIFPRANLMTEFSGGATCEGIRASFRAALDDEAIGSILLDVDSPGGYTDGIEELATEIRESRGRKPIVAISNYVMASAAYYLASQADEVVASPSATVGWVGSFMAHHEFSKQLELEGETVTIMRDPPGKGGGNPFEPLSEQARAEYQAMVDESSAQFHSAVSKARGVPVSVIRRDFGQGGGMSASKAKTAGMVDRVESFDQTVRRLATGRGPVSRGTSAISSYTVTAADLDRPQETDPARVQWLAATQEGEEMPANNPEASASGEAGTPPELAEVELARTRAEVDRRRRRVATA
jgi:signal peptide peptidase SppA